MRLAQGLVDFQNPRLGGLGSGLETLGLEG